MTDLDESITTKAIRASTVRVVEHTLTEATTVAPGVEAQRITVWRKTDGVSDRCTTVSERVVCLAEQGRHYGYWAVVDPELLNRLRFGGWFRNQEDYSLISGEPFTKVHSGEPYEVVRINDYDHSWYDVNGLRLPVGGCGSTI